MTDKFTEDQEKQGFNTWTDNESDPKVFYISIPIAEIAKSQLGVEVVYGFLMYRCVNIAIGIIRKLASPKPDRNIIVPSNGSTAPTLIVQ